MRIYDELNQVGFVCAGDHIFGGSIVARRVLDCNAYRGFVWRVRDENGPPRWRLACLRDLSCFERRRKDGRVSGRDFPRADAVG